MSIIDALKKSVLESFNTALSANDIILSLGVALLASLFILLIYRCTMRQVSFNRSFCISLLLVCAISAMMVLTITSNLALSLGMVGALSIIRFRTAIKDASDTAFLFWSVAAGITAGAGFYLLTLIGCLFVGTVCVLAVVLFSCMDTPFLLVVRADDTVAVERAEQFLKASHIRYRVCSFVESAKGTEGIYEVSLSNKTRKLLSALKELPGITGISIVDCRKA